MEDKDDSLPFFDARLTRKEDRTIKLTVYQDTQGCHTEECDKSGCYLD